jgi:hypothetical protein
MQGTRERRRPRFAAGVAVAAAVAATIAPGAGAEAVRPVLTVSSPVSGATVTPPWPVRFTVAGVKVGPGNPVKIRVTVGGQSQAVVFTSTHRSGVLEVPDDRFWSGQRDVTFTLLRPNGTPYASPRASVTVPSLIITGGR